MSAYYVPHSVPPGEEDWMLLKITRQCLTRTVVRALGSLLHRKLTIWLVRLGVGIREVSLRSGSPDLSVSRGYAGKGKTWQREHRV